MDDPRLWITLLAIGGLAMPAWGLLGAFRHARSTAEELSRELARSRSFFEKEQAELKALESFDLEARSRIRERYSEARTRENIRFTSYGDLPHVGLASESELWSTLVDRVRGDLIWVGAGLVAATAASIWSTWI